MVGTLDYMWTCGMEKGDDIEVNGKWRSFRYPFDCDIGEILMIDDGI